MIGWSGFPETVLHIFPHVTLYSTKYLVLCASAISSSLSKTCWMNAWINTATKMLLEATELLAKTFFLVVAAVNHAWHSLGLLIFELWTLNWMVHLLPWPTKQVWSMKHRAMHLRQPYKPFICPYGSSANSKEIANLFDYLSICFFTSC